MTATTAMADATPFAAAARSQFDSTPTELKQLRCWVLWKYGPPRANGKRAKIPKAPNGMDARVNDPQTWSSFDACVETYLHAQRRGGYDGLGIVFAVDAGIVGIDLDHCLDGGRLRDSALEIVRALKDTYWEVSPSGTGLHGLLRGRIAESVRHRATLADGVGFEVYDSGRYFTITGKRVKGTGADLVDCQKQLDVVIEQVAHASPTGVRSGAQRQNSKHEKHPPVDEPQREDGSSILADATIVERLAERDDFRALFFDADLSAYHDDRSSADLALANMLAAACDYEFETIDRLFRMSALMRSKWDRRHSSDGRTYGQMTIDKACEGAIELAEIASTGEKSEESERSFLETVAVWDRPTKLPVLRSEALYGLAGDVVRIIGARSEGCPAAILSTFLAAFGNAVGQGPFKAVGAARQRARLFFVHVGDTALARKGQTFGDAIYAVRNADESWYDEAYVTGLSSGEGLLQKVADANAMPARNETPAPEAKTINIDSLQDPALGLRAFVYEAEFARLLIVAARDGSTLSPIVREAWDSTRLQLQTRKNPLVVKNAHVSIIGQITADELRSRLLSTDVANGFANRFLFVSAYRAQRLPRGGDFESEEVDAVVQCVRKAIARAKTIERVDFTDEAGAEWDRNYCEADDSDAPVGLVGALLARKDPQILRLSLVYALLDGSDLIDLEHLRAAQAVWDYCEASARYVFGDTLGDDVAQRLLDEIREIYPAGLSRDKQFERLGRHTSASRISAARQALVQHRLAIVRREPTKGRTREVLYAVAQSGKGENR